MPDPSAIWTRGKEKHTEWGGTELKESQMFPHYFNDLLLNRCKQQGEDNGWIVNVNPFEGGSDHTPFLEAKIPGLLLWHFTDIFYHTDADRLAMVSAEEMKNVGVSALATAYALTTADESMAIHLLKEVTRNAEDRLTTEFELSKEEIKNGSPSAKQQHIIKTWTEWYTEAVEKMIDIPTTAVSNKMRGEIDEAKRKINATSERFIVQLK
jgi:aminopeptidase YwaD